MRKKASLDFNGSVCRVWKSRPQDDSSMHTASLVKTITPNGTILVCTKCHQEILDIVAFQNRKFISTKESVMLVTKTQVRTAKEIAKKVETGANILRIRKQTAAQTESLFGPL